MTAFRAFLNFSMLQAWMTKVHLIPVQFIPLLSPFGVRSGLVPERGGDLESAHLALASMAWFRDPAMREFR